MAGFEMQCKLLSRIGRVTFRRSIPMGPSESDQGIRCSRYPEPECPFGSDTLHTVSAAGYKYHEACGKIAPKPVI
jgi:hypothetical protein